MYTSDTQSYNNDKRTNEVVHAHVHVNSYLPNFIFLFIYLYACSITYSFIHLVIYLPTYCCMYLLGYLFIGLCQKTEAPGTEKRRREKKSVYILIEFSS